MAFVAPNGLWLSRSPASVGNASAAYAPSAYVQAIARGDLTLTSVDAAVRLTSATSVELGTSLVPARLRLNDTAATLDAPAYELRGGAVSVHSGALTLGAASNPATPASINGAGVLAGPTASHSNGGYERSIRWVSGLSSQLPASDPEALALAGARSNVGTWDVRGGGIRLIARADASNEVAYGFRINAQLELEMYRRHKNLATGAVAYARVGRFGGTPSPASPLALPTSPAVA